VTRSVQRIARWLLPLLCLCSRSATAQERTLTLLVATERASSDATPLVWRLRAELAAAGFAVTSRASPARSEGELLDELRSVETASGVAVRREGEVETAYVRREARSEIRRLTQPELGSELAAHVLALSVVELVNADALDNDRTVPSTIIVTPPASSELAAPLQTAAPLRSRSWQTSAEFGPVGSPGMSRWAWAIGGALAFAPPGSLGLELAGRWTLIDATSNTVEGTVNVATWDVRGYVLWRAVRSETLEWDIGAGAGALFARTRARARGPLEPVTDRTTSAAVSARSRLTCWLSPALGLSIIAEPGLLLPPLEIFSPTGDLALLGRPWLNAGVGVSFSP
jgi:hypothetical protein